MVARKGGIVRAQKLTRERRREIARQGAQATNNKRTPEERKAAAKYAINKRWEAYRLEKIQNLEILK